MDDNRLLEMLKTNKDKISDDDAMGMIFSNYIDIGGALIGLTVENAIKAGRLLRKYDLMMTDLVSDYRKRLAAAADDFLNYMGTEHEEEAKYKYNSIKQERSHE